MKKLLILLMLLFCTVGYSQTFSLSTMGAVGLQIDSAGNFSETQAIFSIQPQLTIGVFDISLVALGLIDDGLPLFYGGSQVGFRVWEADNRATNLSITGRYLLGTAGKQLFGAGARYRIDRTTAHATVDWNYKEKHALLLLGAAYDIIPALKKHNLRSGGSLPKRINDKYYE